MTLSRIWPWQACSPPRSAIRARAFCPRLCPHSCTKPFFAEFLKATTTFGNAVCYYKQKIVKIVWKEDCEKTKLIFVRPFTLNISLAFGPYFLPSYTQRMDEEITWCLYIFFSTTLKKHIFSPHFNTRQLTHIPLFSTTSENQLFETCTDIAKKCKSDRTLTFYRQIFKTN